MRRIDLLPIANQELTFQWNEITYIIKIKTSRDITSASITRNGVSTNGIIINPNTRLLPYQEGDNFVIATQNDELIDYTKFNDTQELFLLEVGIDI